MPEPITAPTPNAVRLQGPRTRLSLFCSAPAIRASMLLVRNRLINRRDAETQRKRRYRLRWPCAALRMRFFTDPREMLVSRLALGAAFLRAVRFSFFRSVR